jgi:hypothetical protein
MKMKSRGLCNQLHEFLRSPLCGAEPLVCPCSSCVSVGVGGGGGLHFGLVRRALFIFAPRSTPNKLILTAVTLFSQGRVAAWPLAVAAGEDSLSTSVSALRSDHPSAQSPHSKQLRISKEVSSGWALRGLKVAKCLFAAPHDYAPGRVATRSDHNYDAEKKCCSHACAWR